MIIPSGCVNKPSGQATVWMPKRDQPLVSIATPLSGHNTRLARQNAAVAQNFDCGFARNVCDPGLGCEIRAECAHDHCCEYKLSHRARRSNETEISHGRVSW